MYKKLTGTVIGIFCTCSILSFIPADKWSKSSDNSKEKSRNGQSAIEEPIGFPGAEGGGSKASGGRGGKVIKITSLEDTDTPGTLRNAINQKGPRIVVFDISGTIYLKSALQIINKDITIAGQTAPGGGICVAHYDVSVSADNVIMRYLRFRMGDVNKIEADALGGRFQKNVMIDHCSVSWSTDECVSFYQNENFTLQWCMISEALKNSFHNKGSHGYGGIWGGKNATFHHNLVASNDSRNPRLGEYANHAFALTDLVDLRNNVIYNWGGNSCYGGEAMNVNIINCYYKPGPATVKKDRIISIDKNTKANISPNPVYNIWGKYYINGNVIEGSPVTTEDNWTYGVFNQFSPGYGAVSDADKKAIKQNTAHNALTVTTHTAQKAYDLVLKYAGASLVRDAVDIRIINDVKSGKATINNGGNGSKNGILDSQSAVGGWPNLASGIALKDTDHDGMPDEWEKNNGLDPAKNDANGHHLSKIYDNIEVYMNGITAKQTQEQLKL